MPFLSVGLLVRFAESQRLCCLRANGSFRIFVEAAVVVGHACISKTLTTPCHPGWRMRGKVTIKKKKKKKKKIECAC